MDHIRLQIQSTDPGGKCRRIIEVVVRCDGADDWVIEAKLDDSSDRTIPLWTGDVYTITADEKVAQPAPPTDPKRPDVEHILKQATAVAPFGHGADNASTISLCDYTLALEAKLKAVTEERDIFKSADYDALNSKADSLLADLVEAVEGYSRVVNLEEYKSGQTWAVRDADEAHAAVVAALAAAKQYLKGKEKKDDAEDSSKPAQG